MLGQGAAVGMGAALRRQQVDMGHQPARGGHAPQALQQGRLADELNRRAEALLHIGKAQHRRLDRRGGGDGGLQQVGVERQQCWPGPGGALGEHRHRLAGAQRVGHGMHHPQRIALAFPLDEQRAGASHQPAQQRPAPHIGLGDEARLRHRRMQGGDVEPRHMVGHQQRGARPRRATHLQAHAHGPQQAGRPPLDAGLAAGSVQRRKAQRHHRHAMQHMQHQPRHAPQHQRQTRREGQAARHARHQAADGAAGAA